MAKLEAFADKFTEGEKGRWACLFSWQVRLFSCNALAEEGSLQAADPGGSAMGYFSIDDSGPERASGSAVQLGPTDPEQTEGCHEANCAPPPATGAPGPCGLSDGLDTVREDDNNPVTHLHGCAANQEYIAHSGPAASWHPLMRVLVLAIQYII